jgi:DNA helicase-2/ATP-dependent DNA helicase PcrA
MSFYDRKEVRDILAYLKLLANPLDEVSLLRIINTPPRGLGQSSVATLMEAAVSRGKPLWEVVQQATERGELPAAAAKGAASLVALVQKYGGKSGSLPGQTRALIEEIGYQQEIERLYKEPEERLARWNAVEEVVNALASYEQRTKQPTLAGFLEDVALGNREDEDDKDRQLARDCVALMTLHSAKGLEFKQVYMVGMEEGLLPHHRSVQAEGAAIDEERRLCYVGITRAQDQLTLTLALSRMKWGKPRPTHPSRFLYEMTGRADNPRGASIAKTKRAAHLNR